MRDGDDDGVVCECSKDTFRERQPCFGLTPSSPAVTHSSLADDAALVDNSTLRREPRW